MTRIKKNDLVRLKMKPTYYDGQELLWSLGIVLKGPYEENIQVMTSPRVTFLSLVCDVMAEGNVYSAIPLDVLVREQKPLDGAS